MSWTEEQQEALDTRNKNLLLSAAAGSGKTAVLTERIARLVKDPESRININELLVLTFTRAAAAEMKARVSSALSAALEEADEKKDEKAVRHLEKQISLLGSAQISTLDSYFQAIIRQYFYLLDLDPKMRILSDENEEFLLEEEVLSEVLENWYEKGASDFLDTADLFASRYQDSELKRMVLAIYHFACSLPFPEDWISHLPDRYDIPEGAHMDDLSWDRPLLDHLRSLCEKACDSYRQMFDLMGKVPGAEEVFLKQLSDEYAFYSYVAEKDSWKDWFDSPDFRYEKFKSITKKQVEKYNYKNSKEFTNSEGVQAIKSLRDSVKKMYTKSIEPFRGISENQWLSETKAMLPAVKVLSALTLDFAKALKERKKKEGIMDFSDMEHYALEVLLDRDNPDFSIEKAENFPSAAALSIRKKFKEVMIDEYQDTNGVQELITFLLSNGHNRFMVGDIKQSIYRFRQADPTIFLQKYNAFSPDREALSHRIDLNKNFRSDGALLSSINFLFRQIMTKKTLELDYGPAEALYPARHEEMRPETYAGGTVSIELIDKKEVAESEGAQDLKDIENITLEGRLIAQRIQELMDGGKVMNKDGSFRPMRYSDITILLRSLAGKGPALLKVLEDRHIPAVSDKEEDFTRNIEVEILWALLKIIDNPLQDLALAAVLRSFFVGLDEKDLALLYLARKEAGKDHLWQVFSDTSLLPPEKEEKISAFLKNYKNWRHLSMVDGVAPLLREILAGTDYLTYISGLPGGAARKNHVLSFYQLALERDAAPQSGLYLFLNYLSSLKKEEREFKSNAPGSSSDAVHIMTIHKSKGLEFPVVFLADTAKGFNLKDTQQTAICHKDLGLGIQYYDKKRKLRWPSLYWYAVKEKARQESIAEEARLLYVAMTRARDRLFITAIQKDVPSALSAWAASLSTAGGGPKVEPLPSHIISNSTSYLDWIMPAALRHRSMQDAWDMIDHIPCYRDDAEGDTSDFDFHVTSETDLFTEKEMETWEKAIEGGSLLTPPEPAEEKNRETFLSSLPKEIPDWMDRQLTWAYDHPGSLITPAKLTATAAVKLREMQEYTASDEEAYESVILAPDPDALPADYDAPPLFLSGDEEKYEGTGYGTLMHKAMEMIDFTALPPTEEAIREELRKLVETKIFTEEEGVTLLSETKWAHPAKDLLTFAHGPLAKAMKEAKAVRKEMPFSILLPAHDFYPNCEKGEKLFLQGVMDCLLENEKDMIIIDYKTDHTMSEEELAHHYSVQLKVYREAAEKLFGKKVSHLYLWAFKYGKAIEII